MEDLFVLLILAIFGIIGYLVMELVDRSIDRHTVGDEETDGEKGADQHGEHGKPEREDPGLPFFLHLQR